MDLANLLITNSFKSILTKKSYSKNTSSFSENRKNSTLLANIP